MSSKKKPFNDAFAGLKGLLKQKEAERPKAAARPPSRVQERSQVPEAPLDDEALFRQAVGEVAPVKLGPKVVQQDPNVRLADKRRLVNEEDEALARLSELVAGEGPFEVADAEAFIEGSVAGLDPRLRRRLREGEYLIQAQLDLHGLSRAEAKEALEKFIHESRMRARRCVLVVHGRGLNSKDQIPVLKQGVQEWLTHGKLARQVLAFCSAQPRDGGGGALYVLIRQR